MLFLKNLGRTLIYMSIIILSLILIITIFSYFNIFSDNLTKIMKFIIPLIGVFISGIIMGSRTNKKGIIEGMRLSFIIISIFIFLSLILSSFKVNSLIYYVILIITTIFGSVIGAQKKVQN